MSSYTHRFSLRQLFSTLFILFLGLLAATALQAWTGPTGTAPSANVSAPINVGTVDQVKNAGLSPNALLVAGNALVYSPSATLKLGVDVPSPVVSIETAGTIKIGNGGETCQAITEGAIRYDTVTKTLQYCNGTDWYAITATNTNIHHVTFTGSGSWQVPAGVTSIDVLVVGGGGGAGASYTQGGPGGSGGGGAGGLVYRTNYPVTPNATISITVGAGGAGAAANGGGGGGNGSNSVFGSITAIGGGGGGAVPIGQTGQAGAAGGSGGGGGYWNAGTGGAGTNGQGNSGGSSCEGCGGGGGGGGAGAAGSNALADGAQDGGNGGNGILLDISGTPIYYAGGGGGGVGGGYASGGLGGGGAGEPSGTSGGDGTPNTGGGGGGTHGNTPGGGRGGNGGSGVVIIKY